MSSIAAAWYPWATKTSSADSSSWARRARRGSRLPRGVGSVLVPVVGPEGDGAGLVTRGAYSAGGGRKCRVRLDTTLIFFDQYARVCPYYWTRQGNVALCPTPAPGPSIGICVQG